MGQGQGQLLPPPPSTTTSSSSTIVVRTPPPSTTSSSSSSTIVVHTPPQSDGVAIQSLNSVSVDARPDKVPPIPPFIAADAAEFLKFGTIPPSIAADASESLKFGTNTLPRPAAITQCMSSDCTVKPTAEPDKSPCPTVESLCSKFKTMTLVQKPVEASIQFADLGCSCSKSDKVMRTPPSIFDAVEDEARDFSGLDDADPKSDKVPPPPPSTANFVESLSMKLEQKLAGWEVNAKVNTPPSTVNALEYGSTVLEQKLDGAGIQGTGWGWDVGQLQPTGWDDKVESERVLLPPPSTADGVKFLDMKALEQKQNVDGIHREEITSGVKPTGWAVEVKPKGWEDEEISKNAVPMTNEDGNGEGVKYPTWWGAEVKPTGWEDEEISKNAVPMTTEDGNGEGVKYPTWWGAEVKPTGWEDEEISKNAVPMTNEDGNGDGAKYPTWWGADVKPTGWEDEEISKKAVPMTNKDGNGEGVKYPIWPTGWEDGERSDMAALKPNKDGSCEGVKNPGRSAMKYPERPGQPDCCFNVHTGICKFGLNCKFNHPAIRKTRTRAKPKKPPEVIQTGISKLPMPSNTEEPVLGLSAPFHCPPVVTAAAEACPQSKILKEEELEGKSHRDSNHGHRPEGKLNPEESISSKEGKSETDFPQRPGKPDCSYYLRTGNCQFGSNCRLNHPSRRKGTKKDVKEHIKNAPLGKTGNLESKADKGKQSKMLLGKAGQTERKINTRQYLVPGGNKFGTSSKHAQFPGKTESGSVELNFLGLPMRPGERECTNYMHTGVCKFATNCRFHHPNPTPVTAEDTLSASQNAASPQQHASGASPLPTTSWMLPNASCGPLPYPSPPYTPGYYHLPSQGIYPHPGWSEYQVPTIPSFPPEMVSGNSSTSKVSSGYGHVAAAHPPGQTLNNLERPGRPVCHSFVKTGHCKFGSSCWHYHPKDSPESTDGSESARR